MSKQLIHLHHFNHLDNLLQELVHLVKPIADQAIALHGRFNIVLAGGSTPRAFYQRLVALDTDWSKWRIYFGDERCLPLGDTERNDSMALTAWLNQVPIPFEQIYRIPAELGAEQGTVHYRQALANLVNFDLVLLGIGEDGHTASLFPGHQQGETTDYPDVLAVMDAPKPPPERISMSASRLSRSEHVWLIATGEGKRGALEKWLAGNNLPVSAICPDNGLKLFTDVSL